MTAICPRHGVPAPRFLAAIDFNRRIDGGPFEYHRCPDCGWVFLHNVPDDLSGYYPEDYYPVPSSTTELSAASRHERYKIDIVHRFKRNGRLCEIGPAHGAFALEARLAGFDVTAIEMSADCCRSLRELAGVRAVQSDDPAVELPRLGTFDVIALWHVLEHLRDPMRVLGAAARALAPGGILIVAAPNPESWQFEVLGSRWPHLDAPRHLNFLPLPLLTRELESARLRTVWTTCLDAGSRAWNRFGWQMAAANLARSRAARVPLGLAGRLLAEILRPLDDREGRGSSYTLVAAKRAS